METDPVKNRDQDFKSVRKYVTTFKTLAFLSFILGLCLISTCFWVLFSCMENHDRAEVNNPTASGFRLLAILVKQPGATTANNGSRTNMPRTLMETNHDHDANFNATTSDPELKALQKKLVTAWNEVSPYFQGATGLAVVLGLVQVISSMAILSSSTKGATKPLRTMLWTILHCFLVIGFLICILIPVSIDKSLSDGGIRDHLEALDIRLKRKYRHPVLDTEDVDNMKLLYGVLLMDATGLALLLVGGHFLLSYFRKRIHAKD